LNHTKFESDGMISQVSCGLCQYIKVQWYLVFLQAITVFYTLDCYRLFSVFKSL